ncbi:unnamed protein product [Cyberlindnera jadinii]|uniref:Uncharacterized protein n=1 Tax=Cyberlindnera jadinii (strain ATCC 18201 / CBS 1600 / BCRC 20928 / JCM 3617 / NBRC 0987 / NRRL Y-1542) TaxID=983966 RepID=A0A0H5C960_CYBJN|nr:unnamed protein product [Cyberlindnera jadinii]
MSRVLNLNTYIHHLPANPKIICTRLDHFCANAVTELRRTATLLVDENGFCAIPQSSHAITILGSHRRPGHIYGHGNDP